MLYSKIKDLYNNIKEKATLPTILLAGALCGCADLKQYHKDELRLNPPETMLYAKRAVNDLIMGSDITDLDGNTHSNARVGTIESLAHILKDTARAFTWNSAFPLKEEEPKGFVENVAYPFKKLIGDVIFRDVLYGTGGSVLRVGKDLAVGSYNSTLGLLAKGVDAANQSTTAQDFVNASRVYLLDTPFNILPGGEASERVMRLGYNNRGVPLYTNWNDADERYEVKIQRKRIETVFNTEGRKTLETTLVFLTHFGPAALLFGNNNDNGPGTPPNGGGGPGN